MWDQLITSIKDNDTQRAMELISVMSVEELITIDQAQQKTALHYAAQQGLVKICSLLLDKVPGLIEMKDWNGGTVMHYAARGGSTEACLLFMKEAPVMINMKDSRGNTVLHSAAQGGSVETCLLLLDNAPDMIKIANERGMTVLHSAAMGKSAEVCLLLTTKAPHLIKEVTTNKGSTALHTAAELHSPDLEVVEFLSNLEDIANMVDNTGHTPLHRAAFNANVGCAKILIPKMSSEAIEAVSQEGWSALHQVIYWSGHASRKISNIKEFCEIMIPHMSLDAIGKLNSDEQTASDLIKNDELILPVKLAIREVEIKEKFEEAIKVGQMFTKHLILLGIHDIYSEDNGSSNAVKDETVSIAETEQLLAGQIDSSLTDSI